MSEDMPKEIYAFGAIDDKCKNDRYGAWNIKKNRVINETKYIRADLIPQWQPIETAPPNTVVFIFFKNELGKKIIVKAMFVPKLSRADEYSELEFADYDEEDDCYYWPEGWYEDVYAETGCDYSFHHIGNVDPTHWMPLPPPPEE